MNDSDKFKLDNLEILIKFLSGCAIVNKEEVGSKKWLKILDNDIINWEGKPVNWQFVVSKISTGVFKIYEQVSTIVWHCLSSGLWKSSIGVYFIIEFNNGWILKHEPSVGEGYNFIAFDEDFETIQQTAQKHYEENN